MASFSDFAYYPSHKCVFEPYSVDLSCESSVVLPDSTAEAEGILPKNTSDSVELSSESGSVNADAAEEMMLDHENNDYVNPRGVRFTPHKQPKEGSGPLVPYGLPCVRELFRYLVCLVNPHDRHNSETMIQVGLNLITVALEAGADNLGRFSSFLSLIRDETCRNLFSKRTKRRFDSIRKCFSKTFCCCCTAKDPP